MGSCLPNPPLGPAMEYIVLMNKTTSTLPAVQPMGEWFTELSTDIQGDIISMVNENGYPLGDIRHFIEQYGGGAYSDGHYATWCELTEDRSADNDAIESYVDEVGIDNIGGFEDAYVGEYDSEADFARVYFDENYHSISVLEDSGVVIDWQATWDTNLRYNYAYNGGYVFNTNM